MALHARYKKYVKQNKPIDLVRVWIDKPDGGRRPLGVPSTLSRMLLYLMNKVLQIALLNQLPESQHAYMPNKGTLTAWREVIGKVITRKYIYEFDLKKFFDNVSQISILSNLEDWIGLQGKFRELIIEHLQSWVRTPPKRFVYEHKLPEESYEPVQELKKERYRNRKNHNLLYYDGEGQDLSMDVGDLRTYQGVPQGANTSPLLAISFLGELHKWAKRKGHELIMYADDGIIYSDQPIDAEDLFDNFYISALGIEFNREKSHSIREDGIWLRRVKFLGLAYDPWTDKLYSETRNGAHLEFDKHDVVKALQARERTEHFQSYIAHDLPKNSWGTKWADFITTSALGFIQSRLYEGDWLHEDKVEVTSLQFKKKSWCEEGIRIWKDMNLYNASSYAYDSLKDLLTMRTRSVTRNKPTKERELTWNEIEQRYCYTHEHYGIEGRIRKIYVGKLVRNRVTKQDAEDIPDLTNSHVSILLEKKEVMAALRRKMPSWLQSVYKIRK